MENREQSEENSIGDETRVFLCDEEERFQRRFARFIPQQEQKNRRGSLVPKYSEQNVRLIEAEEKIASLQRALEAKSREVERLTAAGQQASKKLSEYRTNAALKSELGKPKLRAESGHEGGESAVALKLLLDDHRIALLKYYTWFGYLQKQCEVMKDLLEESGGWTESNRYRLYFSYREAMPTTISDDMVRHQLARGSVLDFRGVEDIESISDFHPKFRDASCQTDDSAGEWPSGDSLSLQPQRGSELTAPSRNITDSSSIMSPDDLRFLDYREKIQRLECENQKSREMRVILRQKMHQCELLEEQKRDLERQLGYVRAQNLQVIEEYERLKKQLSDVLGACGYEASQQMQASAIAPIVDSVARLKQRNEELERAQLQSLAESPATEEMKLKLAHFFKQKYQKEISELKAKLAQYEPLHPSDTTRIMRFQSDNPLDLAHEEHVMGEAANLSLPSASTATKRPRLDSVASNTQVAMDELQLQLKQYEKSLDIQKHVAIQYRDWVATLTGYQIKMTDEMCEVSSITNPQCAFFFRKNDDGPGVGLTDGGSALEWQSLADNYIAQYHSIPAFLAAVTLSMVESED